MASAEGAQSLRDLEGDGVRPHHSSSATHVDYLDAGRNLLPVLDGLTPGVNGIPIR